MPIKKGVKDTIYYIIYVYLNLKPMQSKRYALSYHQPMFNPFNMANIFCNKMNG